MRLVRQVYNRHPFLVMFVIGLGFGYLITYGLVSLFVSPSSEGFTNSYALGLFLLSLAYFYFGSSFIFHSLPKKYTDNLNFSFMLEEKLESQGSTLSERAHNRINRANSDFALILCGVTFIITAILLYRVF